MDDRRLTFCSLSSFSQRTTGFVGHNIESETVGTASYSESGYVVTLVDTPGFDDSRDGVTDTDILEKIVNFLQEG
jgi:hypothetical protein